jgi:hypothetical protein
MEVAAYLCLFERIDENKEGKGTKSIVYEKETGNKTKSFRWNERKKR